ncbi:MAG: rhomboid family intramembrane serine protease [Bacteroidales bacterium]|nr:rhomboid family intramembrane serine protease [Bacteroidales bacterium]
MAYYDNNYGQRRFLGNAPAATRNIIIINIVVFAATWLGERLLNSDVMGRIFALYPIQSHYFHWWQFITYMYMHGGFWHILFNMYTLYIFGCVVENIIGTKKFITFYTICGVGAAALHLLVQSLTNDFAPTVGASGSIYGVLIAFAILFPESRLTLLFPPVTLSAKWMVIIFAVIELTTGITGAAANVAHFAHLGGMLIGWLLIIYWKGKGTLFDKQRWI